MPTGSSNSIPIRGTPTKNNARTKADGRNDGEKKDGKRTVRGDIFPNVNNETGSLMFLQVFYRCLIRMRMYCH